ncbi:MAG: Gfo/Idh/MocA family oxidoreductase, partial [Candidatus Poribacteria bacterium]
MSDPIRIGFIGTGGNARGHIRTVAGLEGTQVVAFADPSEAALEAAQERLDKPVPTYSDYIQMLDNEEMDGVIISTPHTLHYEQVMAALERGIHVEIEKPMACTSAHAREIMAKQEETGLVVLIGYQRHYDQRFRWVRQKIAEGLIGRVTLTHVFQGQNWLRSQQGAWRLVPELSGGGQLNDSGSHVVDILLWITDLEAEEVFAFVDNRGE